MTVPAGVQIHVGLSTVPVDRISSALQHLLKADRSTPVKGLASVMHPLALEERGVAAAAVGGSVWCFVSDEAAGVATVQAASSQTLSTRVLLAPALCEDPHDVQLLAANLGDAGAETILLSVDAARLANDDLREMVDMACEVDLLGVPMRARLGLSIKPGASALGLASFAHSQCELLHFGTCLAGKAAPRPSELLQALGVKKPDFDFGKVALAEFVPDAA